MTSLESIVQSTKPHIIALCETKLSKNSNGIIEEVFNKKEYKSFPRCTKVGKEGLLIAVKHNTFKSVLEVTQSQLNTIISVRLSSGCSNIRLILGYAPQETEDETVRQQFFDELELEVKTCIDAGDTLFLAGDFNAKISNSTPAHQYGTPISNNGQLLHNILTEQDLHMMNFDAKCQGKWTHVIRTTGASSVLDYVVTDRYLKEHIVDMVIDESTLLCPFTTTRSKGKISSTLSDHNKKRVYLNNKSEKYKWYIT